MSSARWPLAALLAVSSVLYAVRLDYSPAHLHGAEVMFALQAHAIAHTAHDVYGRFMPLYFQMQPLGENTWWHPVIVYWMAIWFQFLDPVQWAVRLPTVVIGILDIALIFFVARRISGDVRWALVPAALLALTPAHYMQSRIAMDYLYPVPFMLAWLLCLLIYLDRKQPWLLFVAGTLLGVGFYSYLAAVLMMPLYLVITCVVLFVTSERWVRRSALVAAGFAWPLAALPFWLAWHPLFVAEMLMRYPGTREGIRISTLIERLSLYWQYFDPAFLFVTGGYSSVMNSTRLVGAFLLPMIVFVPAGLWYITSARRGVRHWLMVVGFFTAPLSACRVPEPYAIDREMVIVPFGALLGASGVAVLWQSANQRVRRAAIVLGALVPLHFAFFCFVYFGEYRDRSAFWFDGNHQGATTELLSQDRAARAPAIYLNVLRIPLVEGFWRLALAQHGREDVLERTVYFHPEEIDVRSIPEGSLLLMTRDDKRLLETMVSGELEKVQEIREIADPAFFIIARRK